MLLMLCLAAIGISSVDPRYFADESGKTWVPIGCNICFDRHSNASAKTRELFDDWMVKFAAGRSLVMIHVGSDGEKVLKLPFSADMTEVFDAAPSCKGGREIRETLHRGDTRVYRIGRKN